MNDDELHVLRAIFGVAVDQAAHRLHDRLAAFYERLGGEVTLKTWAELSNNDRNAYRSALADLAGGEHLDQLAAAARILDR